MYYRPVVPQKIQASRKSDFKKFDAPIAGWISNRNLANPSAEMQSQGAARLDNFFPTATTAVLRRGKDIYAQLGDGTKDVTSIFTYLNGQNRKLFASTDTTIYNITNIIMPFNYRLVTDTGDALVTDTGDHFGESSTFGLNVFNNTLGGNWIVTQFATTGGVYIIGVNGESRGFIYDGTNFYPYVAGGVSTLPYDTGTIAFVPGATLTGGTSGATATIYSVSGTVSAGTLTLTNVTGTFQNNETLTGSGGGGSALANGTTSIAAPGITIPGGLTTADLSHVWVYKQRLWFIEKDSLNAWYMDNGDSVGGALVKYPLGGIMTLGGSLIWGDAWSMDTSAQGGLSDQLAICSTEGQVAIFQGSYPVDDAWTQVGVYRVGTPMGNRAFFKGGGDIAIATSVGLQPLSKAITLDVTALSQGSISYNIQDAWQNAVDTRGIADWQCKIWPDRKMAIISPPQPIGTDDPILFISNTDTGAWCRFTNWDARAMEVFEGDLYFGGPRGEIYIANVTGSDYGQTYTGIYMPLFDDLGTPANKKVPKVGKGVARAVAPLNYSLRFLSDFNMDTGSLPTATVPPGSSAWGTGIWGTAVWGGATSNVITDQQKSLSGQGYATSLAYQVTSGSSVPLDVEIIRLEMSFTTAELFS